MFYLKTADGRDWPRLEVREEEGKVLLLLWDGPDDDAPTTFEACTMMDLRCLESAVDLARGWDDDC